MTPGGRVSAAIEVLADIDARKRPAAEALRDWGLSHRFAGSGDRSAIGNLVFDALRRKSSSAFAMGEETPRAIVLRTLVTSWDMAPASVEALADGSRFAPEPLSEAERAGLLAVIPPDAPDHIRGDYPEWIAPLLRQAFAARAVEEGVGLAERAPVDLRANSLKTTRDKVLHALRRLEPVATAYSPWGARITSGRGATRHPHVEAEPAHGKGWFEVQDQGSQLAVLLSGAGPRQQVLDLCAGAGGKTLALAAAMENSGQLYAYDRDRLRLRPIFDRLRRAGARNVQVLPPGEPEALTPIEGKLDLVLVDAPCTGSGVWRRRPEAKWRVSPEMLAVRIAEQEAVLDQGAKLVRPGGRLAYITCSILPPENQSQAEAFLVRHPEFALQPWRKTWDDARLPPAPASADGSERGLLMTPSTFGTDGFFVAVLQRQ